MPFTPAHAAAAIPFRRSPLIPSALVAGCFSPDFEYFLRLAPKGSFGHTLAGLFALDLPVSVVVLWLFHAYTKAPILAWLPAPIRQRLPVSLSLSSFKNARQIVLILVSIIIGAATHILWDSFTHPSFWPYHHWHFLSRTIRLPIVGWIQCIKILQHLSTIVGLAALLLWSGHWYRNADPNSSPKMEQAKENGTTILIGLCSVALVIALFRGFLGLGVPFDRHGSVALFAETVITAITVLWFEVTAYGVLQTRRRTGRKSK